MIALHTKRMTCKSYNHIANMLSLKLIKTGLVPGVFSTLRTAPPVEPIPSNVPPRRVASVPGIANDLGIPVVLELGHFCRNHDTQDHEEMSLINESLHVSKLHECSNKRGH